jgi:hypothetical protein
VRIKKSPERTRLNGARRAPALEAAVRLQHLI